MGEGEMKIRNVLVATLFIEIVIVCIFFAYRFVNLQSTIALLLFNGLFISIIFQLNGSFTKKIFLLALGNVLGAFWNYLFFQLMYTGEEHFGRIFMVFYVLIFPFVNITWVVPFWSLSVSFLTPNTEHQGKL
jgi:hypothetical protein